MTDELLVASFWGKGIVDEVLTSVRSLQSEVAGDVESSAVMVRRANDKVSIRESMAQNARQGGLVGAAGGSVDGAHLGIGAIKGALLGAVTGAFSDKLIDMGLDYDFLDG